MENNKKFTTLAVVLSVFFALVAGACGGYYYGNNKGVTEGIAAGKTAGIAEGRAALLAKQTKEAEENLKAVQEAANPFAEQKNAVNPFQNAYANPFGE
jgi:hypothetical protein